MAKTSRSNLKELFRNGRMPSENDFADLIDSMINILDEGFDKTARDGLKVTQLMGSGKLMSFYENLGVEKPQWLMELSSQNNHETSLHITSPRIGESETVLSMQAIEQNKETAESKTKIGVGINQKNPTCELDVNGTASFAGRRGQKGQMSVPADGLWYDITPEITGCQAFEVMAGVGGHENEGKFAMIHATVMNTFNGTSSIKYQNAYFGSRCNRIELRWKKSSENKFFFTLQMRVRCSYGSDIWVKYHITQLWFDPFMESSLEAPSTKPVPSPEDRKSEWF